MTSLTWYAVLVAAVGVPPPPPPDAFDDPTTEVSVLEIVTEIEERGVIDQLNEHQS